MKYDVTRVEAFPPPIGKILLVKAGKSIIERWTVTLVQPTDKERHHNVTYSVENLKKSD